MSIEVDNVLEGVVTGITNFGAFIGLPEGKTGLVHISEVADEYVRDVHDFLEEGQKVKVKVIAVDERGKIGLSIKRIEEKKPERQHNFNRDHASGHDFPRRDSGFQRRRTSASFEDKLSKFMKESDERLPDLRRKTDSKRGGRGGGPRHSL